MEDLSGMPVAVSCGDVRDLQRLIEYPKRGFAVEQEVPADVYDAYERLVRAGFDSRLVTG
jgi:hypothetical protein